MDFYLYRELTLRLPFHAQTQTNQTCITNASLQYFPNSWNFCSDSVGLLQTIFTARAASQSDTCKLFHSRRSQHVKEKRAKLCSLHPRRPVGLIEKPNGKKSLPFFQILKNFFDTTFLAKKKPVEGFWPPAGFLMEFLMKLIR